MNAQRIADVLIGAVSDSATQDDISKFTDLCSQVATAMGLSWFIDSGVTPAQGAMILKGVVTGQFDRISAVCAIAAARGYILPDNPLPRFRQLNSSRRYGTPLGLSSLEDSQLEVATYELSKIATAYDAGTITFERHAPAAQVASFEVSVDGISQQSGDPLVDILGYQPDGDSVKRKRALDSLAKLDFSKRKPYMLFTADVIRDGKRQDGTIVCWQRMRDASGYSISKRDVFAMVDIPAVTYTNAALERSTTELKSVPEFMQAISFYDWLGSDGYLAFVDDQVRANTLYSYSVSGLQTKAPSSPYIFDVPTSALYLSTAQADQVRALIQQDIQRFGASSDQDSVSPYPAIAQVVYGDADQSWILAGCNVLASIRRGDSPDDTRRLSYIGSKASDVLALAAAGKLVVPSDTAAVHDAVQTSVSSFGVSQTVLSILDGTGLTIFISGKDDPLGFKGLTPDALQDATGGLAKILSAIDPQSATIDPHTLVSSLSSNAAGTGKTVYNSRYIQATLVTDQTQRPSLESVLGTDVIDLTTYIGISRLMQVIRSVYDFYPNSLT